MYEDVDDVITQKYMKARANIDDLFNTLSELSAISDMEKDFVSWEKLKEKISNLQMVLSRLQDTKELLLAVNLQVHRFMTEHGSDEEYRECSLKDDVTELYERWEDIYEKSGTQLTELETLSTTWKIYYDRFRILNSKVNEIQCTSSNDEDCDKSKISGEDLRKTLKSDLKELKCNAEFLRKSFIGPSSWKSIQFDLRDLEQRIKEQTRTHSVSRNGDHPNSSAEDDPDDHFEDAIQHLEKDNYDKGYSTHSAKEANLAKKTSSRIWRIIRVAVPVQLTLVLLFCLACYLEPNCCDRLNNFSFSLTPHLRYLRGPPPV